MPAPSLPALRLRTTVVVPRSIRAACGADAPALASLDASVNFSPWSEGQFLAACSGNLETVLVVDESGRIEGFAVFSQVLDEASLQSIAIHPEYQRGGLGKALLKVVLVHMQNTGATRCLLEVRKSNAAARRLYERNGFCLDGVRKNYYPVRGGREDALLMSRAL